MAHPSPGLVEVARKILGHEAGRSPDPAASAAAVEAACRRLKDHLVGMLGTGGIAALFTRALRLAQREQTVLAEVAVSGDPAACFMNLAEALKTSTDQEATAATTSLLSHVLGLLVMLLGEELGMQPIRKLWSRVTSVREIDE